MSDAIDRAAEVLIEHTRTSIEKCHCGWGDLGQSHAEHVARALDEAGLLATPEHDAAVAAKALREMRDEMSRWEGWDTRDIGHAFLSESVLDALTEAADRIEEGR